MATKDPHIAMIDAHEELEGVKLMVKSAIARVQNKRERGLPITEDERMMIKAIRAQAIDATRRIQEKLLEELNSHGLH